MQFTRNVSRALVALALLTPSVLLAQAAAPRPVGVVLDLGFVSSTGNTNITTFSAGEKLTWKATPKILVLQTFKSIYGKNGDSVNANLLDVDASADYKLVDGIALTASAGFDRNKFAGIKSRTEESVGLAWNVAGAKDTARFTGGVLWTQQTNTQEVKRDDIALRAGVAYRRPLGSNASLQHASEFIPNLDVGEDWRLNTETSVGVAFSKKLSLKVSYLIKYDNLPEPTFKKSDRIFTTGLQITY